METAIAFILIISILVVIHEYGHFLAARFFGIDVQEFAIGFGPKILTYFKNKGTDFTIRLFPLGGFVKMSGESLEEMNEPNGFQSQATWKRAIIIFNGPLFSFLLAIVIFMLLGYLWGFPDKISNKIQMVMPKTEASRMDLRGGDKILSINGVKLKDPSQAIDIIHSSAGKSLNLEIERNNEILEKTGTPKLNINYFLGANWEPDKEAIPTISAVFPKSELEKQGIEKGNILIEIDNQKISTINDLDNFLKLNENNDYYEVIFKKDGSEVKLKIKNEIFIGDFCGETIYFPEKVLIVENNEKDFPLKSGDVLISINGKKIKDSQSIENILKKEKIKTITTKPLDKLKDKTYPEKTVSNWNYKSTYTGYTYKSVGIFGFIPGRTLKKEGIVESCKTGLKYVSLMLAQFVKIFTSKEIKDNVGGPIAIVSMTKTAVNTGIVDLVILTGGLSLSLAIFNLLPIPPLDGGHLFVMLLESIRRKRFTFEQLMKIQTTGLFVMLLIFVLVFSMDITKLITGALPK